jgi:hypothetical protein
MRLRIPIGLAVAGALGFGFGYAQTPPPADAGARTEAATAAKLRKVLARERRGARALRRTYVRLRSDYKRIGLYVSPRESAWLCIHEHEGAWNANTGNGYQGGLQMDESFQRTYGPEFRRKWGPAHLWAIWAQIKTADRAFDGFAGHGPRGFGPWPVSSRLCGLR